MTNKTPPAWAIKAAKECTATTRGLLDEKPGTSERLSEIIASNAPDAEALAEALEQAVHYLADLNGCEWIKGDDAGSLDMKQRAKTQQTRAYKALASYRSRFPKVTP